MHKGTSSFSTLPRSETNDALTKKGEKVVNKLKSNHSAVQH